MIMPSLTSNFLPLLLFIESCAAICCYNHNPLCVVADSITCNPNCADGVSQCDLTTQVCADDHFGGCVDILTTTVTTIVTEVRIYSTVTEYTATSDEAVATTTNIVTQTSESVYEITTLSKRNLDMVTTTESIPTSSMPPPAHQPMELLKRVQTPTTTITTTITSIDFDYCSTAEDPICTATLSTLLINQVTASAAVTTTLVNVVTSTITTKSTEGTATSQTAAASASPSKSGAVTFVSQRGSGGQWVLLVAVMGVSFLII